MPKRRMMAEVLGKTLPDQAASVLAKGFPTDATEFDRICYAVIADYVHSLKGEQCLLNKPPQIRK